MKFVNHHEKECKKTDWVLLFIYINTAIYFDSFQIEYIPEDVLNKIRDKSITHNIIEYNLMIPLYVYFVVMLS